MYERWIRREAHVRVRMAIDCAPCVILRAEADTSREIFTSAKFIAGNGTLESMANSVALVSSTRFDLVCRRAFV